MLHEQLAQLAAAVLIKKLKDSAVWTTMIHFTARKWKRVNILNCRDVAFPHTAQHD